MWLQAATIIDGWLAAKLGSAADGLQRMRAGLDGLKSVGVGIVRPFFLSLVAEVCCSLLRGPSLS